MSRDEAPARSRARRRRVREPDAPQARTAPDPRRQGAERERPAGHRQPEPLPGVDQGARAYEGVVAHVRGLIEAGTLAPGDKLPSESALAERFQVGRSSVRDAIRVLEVKGLVKARQGGGTVVQAISADSLMAHLADVILTKRALAEELMDVRSIVEPALAARAAENASPEQIAQLRDILGRHRQKVRGGELTVAEDFEFHNLIASAAGNSVVLAVLDTLVNVLSETRRRTLQVKGRPQASLAGHERVLRAIEARDAAAAESAMRDHLRSIAALIVSKRP